MWAAAPSSIWWRCARRAGRSSRSAILPSASMRAMLNKRALESMAKAGAFDCLNPNRAQVLDAVESFSPWPTARQCGGRRGQNDLFGGMRRVHRKNWCCRAAMPGCRWTAGAGIRGRGLLSLGPSAGRLHEAAAEAWCGYLGLVPREGADQGSPRREARRHHHPPAGAALEIRQQVRLRRLLRSHRAVRSRSAFPTRSPPAASCWSPAMR